MSRHPFIGPPARRRRRGGGGLRALVLLVLAGAIAGGALLVWRATHVDRRGARVVKLGIDSRLVHRRLEQQVAVPAGGARGRPLLIFLHGRGSKPDSLFTDAFYAELERLGPRAPVVVAVDGGDHSYYHDRSDGRWGTYVVREVIPAVLRRFDVDGARIALGGTSMGGFGALDIASREPGRFCAVGGHSAALWRRAADTPPGAFDDARDFARHDVYGRVRADRRLFARERIWLDVGRDDPFRPVDAEVARILRRRGVEVAFHEWPGGHGGGYFGSHVRDYLRWYAGELERCRTHRSGS
jgi:S-formylglutathione hydrolase FrmB